MKRFRVDFSPEAVAHVDAIDVWWRANRDRSPGLFARELAAAIRHLRRAAGTTPLYDGPIPGTRRLLLPRTRHHVYFVIDDAAAIVRVYAVWHANRGAAPAP